MTTQRPILCVGALTLDTIYRVPVIPRTTGKVLADDARVVAAGMSSSAAAAIVRLGGAAAIWATAGDDPAGRFLVDEMSAGGVDTRHVRVLPDVQSAVATVFVDRGGERLVVAHYGEELRTPPEDVPDVAGAFAAVMADVRWPAAAALALRAARDAGLPAILDADTGDPADIARLAGLATDIVAARAAAESLTGLAEPGEAVRELARRHGDFAAVTDGGRGCFWSDGGPVRQLPAFDVAVVDTNSAGDVFHGAFALARTEGRDRAAALAFAAAASALKCTRFGGIAGTPARDEVDAFLAERGLDTA